MHDFCVARLSPPPRLRARHGVLQLDAMAVADDAQRAAALILQQAQSQRDAMLAEAAAQASDLLRAEQQRVAQEAELLLRGLREAQDRLLDGIGPLVADLAARAFEHLVLEQTPAGRIAAAVRRVSEEAPQRLVAAVAWMHPEDLPLVGECPWEVRPDARLPRGTCKLEAASGEWIAGFTLGAQALQQALQDQAAALAPATGPAGPLESAEPQRASVEDGVDQS